MQNLPAVTRALLIANIAVFVLQQLAGNFMLVHFALWPIGNPQFVPDGSGGTLQIGFQIWQIVTYAFLHDGYMHIAFNMFALYMFGGQVETALGAQRFTIYYLVCVLGAAIAQLAVIHFFKPEDFYPTLGASGGVFGLLLAFAVIYPTARVLIFPIPFPLLAPVAIVGYMAIELVFGITGTQEGVAHFAHLGGAVAGFVLLQMWRSKAQARPG
jgi:membrane associated rhomboid family serine protease